MTRVSWNDVGQRFYEAGTDRGVLYIDGQNGVPWNGLVGVSENSSGGEPKAYYLDGYKYLNVASAEDYAATINAFTSPREFDACDGTAAIQNGLFATQQPRKTFGFSYRTLIGNDVDGLSLGYKIHIVYNALASPVQRSYKTNGDSASPLTLDWSISTLAPRLTGIRPTAHFVIDSRLTPPRLLESIEDILYGSNSTEPRLPTAEELAQLFMSLPPIAVVNWLTNGSFELAGGTIAVRRNLNLNPRMINSADNWTTASGTATITPTSDGNQVVLSTPVTTVQPSFYHSANQPTSAGLVYSSSMEVTVPADSVAITFLLRTHGYGTDAPVGESDQVTILPGQTVTLVADSNGVATTAATTGIRTILYVTPGAPAGAKFVVRNALLEQAPKAGPYFDGNNPVRGRRNAAPQSQAKSTTGWVSNNGTLYTRTWDPEGGRRSGMGAAVFTRSSSGLNSSLASVYGVGMSAWVDNANWVPVLPGDVWTISGYATSDVPFNTTMIVSFRDINGNPLSPNTGNPTNDTAANEWARATHTVVVPEGAVYMGALQNVNKAGSDAVGGEKTRMTDALFEKASSLNPWFDPTSDPIPGFVIAWEGTATSSPSYIYDADFAVTWVGAANSSMSDLTAVSVATYSSPSAIVRAIQSTRFVESGNKSIRQIPVNSVRGVSYTEIANQSNPKGLVPGNTYTFVATFYQEAAQGFGGVNGSYRSLSITSDSQPNYNAFAQADDISGRQIIRMVFTIPPTGDWAIRMCNGGMLGDPSVWWDNAAIFDGVYQGDAFDGDTTDTDVRIYSWAGGQYLSPSTLRSWYY